MARRAGLRGIPLALLAAALTVSPGKARIADPPAAELEFRGRAGLICVWAIYASMLEVGRRCGGPRNAPLQAELERSAARIEDYARRQSPERAASMADYRARMIAGDAQLCQGDGPDMYRQLGEAAPGALHWQTDRLLASSPAVEWGACL